MKSLFHPEVKQEILERMSKLSPESTPTWGSMEVAQMLKHVTTTIKVATGETPLSQPPWYFKIGLLFYKPLLYNDKPWKKNIPTARELRMRNPEDFNKEREELKASIDAFLALPFTNGKLKHPIFGWFTKDQWGKMQYKHLDHHFRQFRV